MDFSVVHLYAKELVIFSYFVYVSHTTSTTFVNHPTKPDEQFP
jgi:hypothetical protein